MKTLRLIFSGTMIAVAFGVLTGACAGCYQDPRIELYRVDVTVQSDCYIDDGAEVCVYVETAYCVAAYTASSASWIATDELDPDANIVAVGYSPNPVKNCSFDGTSSRYTL